jgi:hypothetical protein
MVALGTVVAVATAVAAAADVRSTLLLIETLLPVLPGRPLVVVAATATGSFTSATIPVIRCKYGAHY